MFFSRLAKIGFLFFLIFNANANANANAASEKINAEIDNDSTTDSKNRVTLPPLSIDEYESEIKILQKLQRDNARLKLEVERARILQELKKYGSSDDYMKQDGAPKIWVVSVYKLLNGRYRAQVVDPVKGLRIVSVGDEIASGLVVYKISATGVIVRSNTNMQYTLLFTPFGTWVA